VETGVFLVICHTEDRFTMPKDQQNLPGMDLNDIPSQDGARGKRSDRPGKVFSKLFEMEIWIVEDKEEMDALVAKGVREPVYLRSEIHDLLSRDRESLKAVNDTKRIFPGAVLE